MAKGNSNKKNNNDSGKRMDQARKMAARNANQKKKKKGSTLEYWKGVKTEMSKVIWPTKQELGAYTVVVVVTCAFFALAFWGIDSAWLAGLKAILGVTLS